MMKTIQLKTAMAFLFWSYDLLDQSESIKTNSDHVTHKVKKI